MSLQKISRGVDFVINRISRLYPTYWASVTFTFILVISHSIYKSEGDFGDLLIKYLGNLTMFQFYLRVPDLDGPYWSLIIEMLFYLFVLLLFQIKWLKYLNTIGIVLCSATVLLSHYYYEKTYMIIKGIPLLQFLPLFLAGTNFYKIYTKKDNIAYNYLIVLFCFICQILLFSHAGFSNTFINWTEYIIMLFIYFSLFTLFVNNRLTFITNKTTLFLGKISYALYLIHQFVSISLIIPFFYDTLGLNFWIVTIFINLPVVIAVATFITYKIEVPYSKKMKKLLKSRILQKSSFGG
jgi:peptidoglycan/LPS O-acetylase OafA/YrhL